MYTTLNLIVFIVGILLFIANWILNKDFNPVKNTVSQYAYGKYGFLTTLGFVFIGIASCFLAKKLWNIEADVLYSVIVIIIASYGFLIASLSVFRCDKPGSTTFRGKMHNILAITGLVTLSIGMLLYLIFGVQQHYFSYATLILAITNFTSLLLLQFASSSYQGIWERGAIFSQFFWLVYLLV